MTFPRTQPAPKGSRVVWGSGVVNAEHAGVSPRRLIVAPQFREQRRLGRTPDDPVSGPYARINPPGPLIGCEDCGMWLRRPEIHQCEGRT